MEELQEANSGVCDSRHTVAGHTVRDATADRAERIMFNFSQAPTNRPAIDVCNTFLVPLPPVPLHS